MSMQQTPRATIRGLLGPYYPTSVTRFASVLNDIEDGTGARLDGIAGKTPGFVEGARRTASDGYGWFWLGRYKFGPDEVWVAVPWRQDSARRDNCEFDRAPAVYCTQNARERIDSVVENLTEALRAHMTI